MRRRAQLGITLIELIFSVFLFGMILTISFLPFKIMTDSFKLGGSRGDISSNTRIQLQSMLRTLQQGTNVTFGGSTDLSSTLPGLAPANCPSPQIPKGETSPPAAASLISQYIYTQAECNYFYNGSVASTVPIVYYTAVPQTPGADPNSECSLIQAEKVNNTWTYKTLIPRGIYQCYFIPHPNVTQAYQKGTWNTSPPTAPPAPNVSQNTYEYAYVQVEMQVFSDDAPRPLPCAWKQPINYSEQFLVINGSEQIPPNATTTPAPPASGLNPFLYPGSLF
jgi:hypothetical protein